MIEAAMLGDDRTLRAWAIEQAAGDVGKAKAIESYVKGDDSKLERPAAVAAE